MDRRLERIVLAGGGTGGHLYPALAVADELRRRRPAAEISFFGAERGLEQRLVPAAGYPLRTLPLAGLKGASLWGKLRATLAAGWAVVRSVMWMTRERPNLVIGVGGYASGPAMLAAWILRRPTLVMEQNHFPGATNRWLAPRVDAVCVPSEAARNRVSGQVFVTGNPVRAEFFEIGPATGGHAPDLLVFGGSRGAHSINMAMLAALDDLARCSPRPRILHQTGAVDEQAVREKAASYPGDYEVHAFLDDMPQRFRVADLIVCRSGASTISELCAAGRPAILVPYPHAADDHQTYNARTLAEVGAAIVLPDAQLDGLAATLAELTGSTASLREMGAKARRMARPDAAARIVKIAEDLLDGGSLEERHVS